VLNDEERREIQEAITHYEDRRSAVITVLRTLQRHRGWISDESLADVAEACNLTPDEVESRASFYNLIYRKPVGRHVILVCDSFACWTVGYQELRDALFQQLGIEFGQTTRDGRFTLLPIVCLGACDLAPAMKVDDDLHGPVWPDDIYRVLSAYP
jgi:NADH-quinone oxidoreductase subunit E